MLSIQQREVAVGFKTQEVIERTKLSHFLYEFKQQRRVEFWDQRRNIDQLDDKKLPKGKFRQHMKPLEQNLALQFL